MKQKLIALVIIVLIGSACGNSVKEKSMSTDNLEQAVIVHFKYGIVGLDSLFKLEDILERLIADADVGVYDGHEIAVDYSDGFLYMYGPNAETLFKTIKPTLEKTDFMKGAKAKLRFGPPEDGVKEIEFSI
ncbi:MAG: hypothetical protein RIF39_15840 [Cyclobacteriaceae bacterium]